MENIQDKKNFLKVTTDWTDVEIISEPYVILTIRGYAPAVTIKNQNGEELGFYLSAKSLSDKVEELRKKNNNNFTGIKFKVKK